MKKTRTVRRRGTRGFTLIEILVALFIFLTGVTGILALMTTALALHRDGLQIARATRQLDDVIARVQREISEGKHRDTGGDFADVPAQRLPDGTWCSVHFVDPVGVEPLVAEIRLAGSQAGLPASRPVRAVLAEGLRPDLEVARLREARTRAAPEKP
jgi:prepilin-type N-terminal cleavage/methylation domain-containing protein